jgi:hypothetical protein
MFCYFRARLLHNDWEEEEKKQNFRGEEIK